MSLSKAKAEALWDKLATQFLEFEQTLKEIITQHAWEGAGYSTFAEAWNAKMRHVTLFAEFRPHVVYQLLGDGQSPDEVAASVKGIGPRGAEILDRKRKAGIPADVATVREHLRKKPEPADTLHIKVGHAMLAEYRRIANVLGQSAEDIAQEAIAARFAELVKPKRRRSA